MQHMGSPTGYVLVASKTKTKVLMIAVKSTTALSPEM